MAVEITDKNNVKRPVKPMTEKEKEDYKKTWELMDNLTFVKEKKK
jgi:hypothetical protein